MAPPSINSDGRYDPPIPTYEQATLGEGSMSLPSPSTFDPLSPMAEAYYAPDHESRSLLRHGHQRTTSTSNEPAAVSGGARARTHPSEYRPPMVETDDEGSTWSSSDSEEDERVDTLAREAAHVRREMQELEMEDPLGEDGHAQRGRSSIFGKAIGFSISLPRWKWNWHWSMPRLQVRMPSDAPGQDSHDTFRSRLGPFGRLAGFSRLRSNDADAEAPDAGGPTVTGIESDEALPVPSRQRCWPRFLTPNPSTTLLILVRLLAVVIVLGFIYVVFISDLLSSLTRRLGSQSFDPESVRIFIQSRVDREKMQGISKHFTSYAHMAGTEGDFALAIDVKNLFERYGLEDVSVDEYYVYLNYPTADGRAVEILGDDGAATWSAKLEEDHEEDQATAGHQTYAFHGLSKAGDVKGPLIYANYGSPEDFKRLQEMGIDTRGAIALVRYYGTQSDRSLKVKAAELAGFAGCLIYSDPADDGFLKGDVAPDGPYMPADGVQRGSVSLMSWVVGDVLTPGWESKKGLPRVSPEASPGLVKIPSLPLAWRDAQVLLQHLQGAGMHVPDGWQGGVPDVEEWWTGNTTGSPMIRLKNEQDEVHDQPIWNVYGRIVGVEQAAKKVLIGNHRDAWTFGASDPHSGTAIMLEVARIFGELLEHGWRPLRTIEFMSWDAEEYNLIGSTEYVEKNLDSLRGDALAYINLDTAVSGSQLRVAGSPIFSKLLVQALKRVSDPHANASLFDLWLRHKSALEVLGAGSDYVAFQDIAGTSSLDLHFDPPDSTALPLHSAYESYDWMSRVGDPDFIYHGLLAEVVGLLLIELSDRPVIPFDMAAYSDAIVLWTNELAQWVHDKMAQSGSSTSLVDFDALHAAAEELVKAVNEFQDWERKWESQVLAGNGWEPTELGHQREEFNNRMAMFETDLLDLELGGGIPNRTQFRHILYGPSLWDSYEGDVFPAVRDAVNVADWSLANRTVAKVSSILYRAATNLVL